MIANDFAEFVSSQQSIPTETRQMWTAMLHEWLQDIDRLHRQIVDFLRDYVNSGLISYSFTDVTLDEENIGVYTAKRMDIRIGSQQIYLEPIGTLLIGSKGRVDVVGSAGRVPIFLVGAHVKGAADLVKVTVSVDGRPSGSPPVQMPTTSWIWKIVAHTIPRTFVDLEKDSFFTVLLEVANA